jgi:hypothetical protein
LAEDVSRLAKATATATAITVAGSLLVAGPADAGGSTAAASRSLPRVASGARPGPDLLYAKPVTAPQLQNTGPWHAKPILISGAESYRDGEWLYQDYLQDDHGARGVLDPTTPYDTESHTFSPAFGSYTYPTDKAFAFNGADLVELRVRPLDTSTAFRVTLNTLKAPDRTAFTIALGGSSQKVAWPHHAGVKSPAGLFLTWHGDTAELTDAAGHQLTPRPTVAVDTARNQVAVRVPHAAWNPGRRTIRTTIGVGLWDTAAGSYLVPGTGTASATKPGGGNPLNVAIVNVGPRRDEPWPLIAGATIADTAVGAAATSAFWRERQQALQLALGDVSPFAANIDFGKLRDRRRDDSAVPKRGPMDRILSSRFSFGEGLDPDTVCFSLLSGSLLTPDETGPAADCTGSVTGRLQSYALYVPRKPRPDAGWGLTLLPHSLSANYNQYAASSNQSELGERATGSIVVTPSGRGPDGFYAGAAEADLFETWADVAHHYDLDPRWTAISGYSMGGFATYRMLARWPDLFGRGFSVVGAPGTVGDQLASLRNNPLMSWAAGADELVNLNTQRQAVAGLQAAGVRFTNWTFPTADHLTLAANDEYGPGAAFLGHHLVARDPRHVTYVVDRREDTTIGGIRADHAWWLSDIRPADASATGTVDAHSLATRRGDAPVLATKPGAGVLLGGQEPLGHVTETQAWGAAPGTTPRDVLVLRLDNVARVVVDGLRAGLTCGARVRATSDTDAVVVLAGCGRQVVVPAD